MLVLWPDVQTQADYQLMDPNFVGLIFSCFSETDKVYHIYVIVILICMHASLL